MNDAIFIGCVINYVLIYMYLSTCCKIKYEKEYRKSISFLSLFFVSDFG